MYTTIVLYFTHTAVCTHTAVPKHHKIAIELECCNIDQVGDDRCDSVTVPLSTVNNKLKKIIYIFR